ncbi:MAG TPA: NUDIX domain-containing protein [Mycobacteriales bacterium]|nr:NUDIX domain-containing protein [Mycobacteriales bacterium]
MSYLLARPDATRRACRPGHLTASALVLDATGEHALLTLHPRVGAWVVVGGHIEPEDDTVLATATREAYEESGMPGLRLDPVPIYLGAHPVTCSLGIPTRHLDVTFLAVAPPGAQPVRSDESLDLAWFPVGALPENVVPDLPPLLARGLARMGGS